jgi:hypothetical protein
VLSIRGCVPYAGGGRKRFFFEKKKQKTFDLNRLALTRKSFLVLFFKNGLLA